MNPWLAFFVGVGVGWFIVATGNYFLGWWENRWEKEAQELMRQHLRALDSGNVSLADQTKAELEALGYRVTAVEGKILD